MTSKKHYVAVAELFKAAAAHNRSDTMALDVLDGIARGLGRIYQADNAAFDEDRFLKACDIGL